jgi:hypothetical protein
MPQKMDLPQLEGIMFDGNQALMFDKLEECGITKKSGLSKGNDNELLNQDYQSAKSPLKGTKKEKLVVAKWVST